ncbi:protein kinase [Rhodococcus erythropolis]|uniref:protein kinase domain-containing protein n=1 Tax=Rhodococcus TaxID=1827 RepID=UPI00087306B8|nr:MULTISPECIES: protein kinase [Rhodococcus]MDV6208103.1 protein kinase [Rhodococcus erythropolis]OFE08360.1 hypothetical protein A5N83_12915 [Rhodococcus sp. 1139]
MSEKTNKFALRRGATYANGRRWRTGEPLTKYKHHVLEAHDLESESGDEFVIKGTQYARPKSIKRFRKEISGMKRLTNRRTPGVLPLIDSKSTATELWYVMPKAQPLADYLMDCSFDDTARAFVVLADTLASLRMESDPISHRDIKPDNLFWFEGGPVLADFGIATWPKSQWKMTEEGDKVGPMYYLAPEARYNREGIKWEFADIYSLAMTFWSIAAPRDVSKKGQVDRHGSPTRPDLAVSVPVFTSTFRRGSCCSA